MHGSKLTHVQRQQLERALSQGQALPLSLEHPVSHPPQAASSFSTSSKRAAFTSKPTIRTLQQIVASRAHVPDRYHPQRMSKDFSVEKEKLQEWMEGGGKAEVLEAQARKQAMRPASPPTKSLDEFEMCKSLWLQIILPH
jgi:hypothetical protein